MPRIETANATVHFVLEVRKGKTDGKIYGYIKNGGKKYKFYPDEKCPVAAWDKARGMPKTGLNRRDFIPLANRLKEVEAMMLQVWEQEQGKFTPATFRDYVSEALKHNGAKESFGVPDFIDAYLQDPNTAVERLDEMGESSRARLLEFVRLTNENAALKNIALGRDENTLSLIDFIPVYLEAKKKAKWVNYNTMKSTVRWYVHLAAFMHVDGEADYEDVANNFEWRDRFLEFLYSDQEFTFPFKKGLEYFKRVGGRNKMYLFDKDGNYQYTKPAFSINSANKAISALTQFVNDARRRGHTDCIIHKGFNIKKAKANKVVLYSNELEKIARCDLQGNERLEKVRFLLFVGCYTGLRFSDWHKINRNAIKEVDGERLIEVITEKTKTPVHIPLFDRSFEKMLEDWNYKVPRISGQKFNDYVKELCQLAGIDDVIDWAETVGNSHKVAKVQKWEKVSSHVGRRTLATMLVEKGYPASTIMGITGHSSEQQFWEYVNLDKRRRAAAISRQMKKEKERILKVV